MPATKTFEYRSVDAQGKRAKGKIEAVNETAAASQLRQQGVIPLALVESTSILQRDFTIPGFNSRVTLKELAVLSRQFATMAASGISLLRALAVLEDQATKPKLKQALADIRSEVEAGSTLSAALGKYDRIFPVLMVAMVKAGETGGFLDSALDRVATTLEKDAALRSRIKSAMTYPMVVSGFTVILVAGVLIFIVPIFEKMFTQLGGQLPLPTRIVVNTSHAMVWLGPLLVAAVVGGTAGMRQALLRSRKLRLRLDQLKLRIPVFGPLFAKVAISRFTRTLGTLLGVGVPVMQALDVVGDAIGNRVYGEAMADLQTAIRDGRPMSAPLHGHRAFPEMVVQMIEVGEESGQISQMLDKIADFYDREVDAAAEALTSSIEPILVLFMGGVVGVMIICLYLPMFTVYQHIDGAT